MLSQTMKNKNITARVDSIEPNEDIRFHEKKASG